MLNEKKCCCCGSQSDERLEGIKKAIDENKSKKGGLIPVLHIIQDTYGYLPEDVLHLVSDELKVPMTEIYGVATFYSIFSLEPKGEHIIKVCLGTACYVKGSQDIIDKLSELLDVEIGKTTKDGKYTLEATRCLGACGLAPVMTVDDKVYGRLVPNDLVNILKEYD